MEKEPGIITESKTKVSTSGSIGICERSETNNYLHVHVWVLGLCDNRIFAIIVFHFTYHDNDNAFSHYR